VSSLDSGFGKLIVFGSVFFGFDHVTTKDEGGEVFVDGWPPGGDALLFSGGRKFCNFVFPSEGEGFFEDFADTGPVV